VYLTNLWEELLEHRPIEVTANFFELGGHSLLAARLSATIERALGTKLPLAAFLRAVTIEQQARLLRAPEIQRRWPSLVPIRTNGSKPPLFCVHLADGQVLSYRDLVRHLPSDQPLYGLQSRGLDGASRINTSIEDMARDYVREIRALRPAGPYAICGWSFGGLVAYEMARQLEEERLQVALVAMFDTHVPGRLHEQATAASARRLALARARALLSGPDRVRTAKRLCEAGMWRALARWHRYAGWLPRPLRNVTQANRSALRHYVPRVYGGRVVLFKAAEHHSQRPRDPLLGWGPFVAGAFEIYEVPGHHGNMVFEPHARTLADRLAACLNSSWTAACGTPGATNEGGDRAA
jgi:thioesterase domain-containing protein